MINVRQALGALKRVRCVVVVVAAWACGDDAQLSLERSDVYGRVDKAVLLLDAHDEGSRNVYCLAERRLGQQVGATGMQLEDSGFVSWMARMQVTDPAVRSRTRARHHPHGQLFTLRLGTPGNESALSDRQTVGFERRLLTGSGGWRATAPHVDDRGLHHPQHHRIGLLHSRPHGVLALQRSGCERLQCPFVASGRRRRRRACKWASAGRSSASRRSVGSCCIGRAAAAPCTIPSSAHSDPRLDLVETRTSAIRQGTPVCSIEPPPVDVDDTAHLQAAGFSIVARLAANAPVSARSARLRLSTPSRWRTMQPMLWSLRCLCSTGPLVPWRWPRGPSRPRFATPLISFSPAALFAPALLCTALACQAARPLATEDSDVLAAGDCEWESFVARETLLNSPSVDGWATQGVCGVGFISQVGLAYGRAKSEGPAVQSVALVGKTALIQREHDGLGLALAWAVGGARDPDASFKYQFTLLNLAASKQVAETLTFYANLGWVRSRSAGTTTWNLAAELALDIGIGLAVEAYGFDRGKPWLGAGVRWNATEQLSFNASYALHSETQHGKLLTVGFKLAF